MGFRPFNRQLGALFVSGESTMLARVNAKARSSQLTVMANSVGEVQETGPEILAGIRHVPKRVGLVMPLSEFALVSLTVAPMAQELLSKTLPYSLGKTLDRPVSDFVYDYQITQRFKDRFELTVFLFSADRFRVWEQAIRNGGGRICWFEPDVFAGCNWILSQMEEKHDFLCLLVWDGSLSLAVCTDGRIAMVRNVEFAMATRMAGDSITDEPGEAAAFLSRTHAGVEQEETEPVTATTETQQAEDIFRDEAMDELLAGFGLQQNEPRVVSDIPLMVESEDGGAHSRASDGKEIQDLAEEESVPSFEMADVLHEPETGGGNTDDFQQYLADIHLELVRTLDYHNSILKGKEVSTIYVGGKWELLEELLPFLAGRMDYDVHRFPGIDGQGRTVVELLLKGVAIR